jgi:hypothetical protein
MKRVAIFGGSGLIGGELARVLTERGDRVTVVSRRPRSGDESGDAFLHHTWRQLEAEPELLEGYDAFVNLAGETINQRWTDKAKRRIVDSRLEATRRVSEIVSKLERKPEVVVNASGMSIYGYSEEDAFDEDSPVRPTDFLARTVQEWEKAADDIRGVRLVKLRIGLVLGTSGGAFPLVTLPYRLFVGGRVGSGRQWMSWIHIRDMVGIIAFAIDHKVVTGPVNCTAPHPVTNDEFGRAVARALGRPHWFPVPAVLLKVAFGEMAEVLLKGQRVLPKRMTAFGYAFRFRTIDEAAANLLRARKTD